MFRNVYIYIYKDYHGDDEKRAMLESKSVKKIVKIVFRTNKYIA